MQHCSLNSMRCLVFAAHTHSTCANPLPLLLQILPLGHRAQSTSGRQCRETHGLIASCVQHLQTTLATTTSGIHVLSQRLARRTPAHGVRQPCSQRSATSRTRRPSIKHENPSCGSVTGSTSTASGDRRLQRRRILDLCWNASVVHRGISSKLS
ncbi:hypothetical protein K437DRAFT_185364 [Tilletiaria anomala UBC 951]|uniref:Uncharacterized protein n=1 Tax=Tilletiaria anomala (strain ATCC 24038 / CBS 436.72 / UBC 951) TaxID=1037660 RepID=A0A066VPA8_TILAU|nr:uncharacterized protein K437DRAFT_185364 [Tilletiaria anomala UBC 951]KDN40614.1 hypothetical protein K437DRAFT_185364 [Tilletiaria anomala UBC 951]